MNVRQTCKQLSLKNVSNSATRERVGVGDDDFRVPPPRVREAHGPRGDPVTISVSDFQSGFPVRISDPKVLTPIS